MIVQWNLKRDLKFDDSFCWLSSLYFAIQVSFASIFKFIYDYLNRKWRIFNAIKRIGKWKTKGWERWAIWNDNNVDEGKRRWEYRTELYDMWNKRIFTLLFDQIHKQRLVMPTKREK